MFKNLRFYDRTLRFIIGAMMVTWAVAGGPLWAWIGVGVLATGAWGFCPIYRVFGINKN